VHRRLPLDPTRGLEPAGQSGVLRSHPSVRCWEEAQAIPHSPLNILCFLAVSEPPAPEWKVPVSHNLHQVGNFRCQVNFLLRGR
jgi:hypothetical protein